MNPLDTDPYALSLSPTMIRSNFFSPPTWPPTLWDLIPFLCASGYALIFTALLVLLVEDDSNDSKVLGEQQSQLTSQERWIVGLTEKERESSMHSQSSYYGYSPVQRNVTGHGFPGFSHLGKPPTFLQRLFGACLSHLVPIPHLIYVLLGRTSRRCLTS